VAKAVRNKVEVKRVEAKKAAAVEDRKVEAAVALAAVVKRCKTRGENNARPCLQMLLINQSSSAVLMIFSL
jgi:hypothetical protein